MYLGTDDLLCFHLSFKSSHSGGFLFVAQWFMAQILHVKEQHWGEGMAFLKGRTKEIQSPFKPAVST